MNKTGVGKVGLRGRGSAENALNFTGIFCELERNLKRAANYASQNPLGASPLLA
jgi:hypothetical protein